MELVDGLEPPTCWLQISCSTNWATPAWIWFFVIVSSDYYILSQEDQFVNRIFYYLQIVHILCFSVEFLNKKKNGRGDRTRTCGILVPNQALYQTELRPEFSLIIIPYRSIVCQGSKTAKSSNFLSPVLSILTQIGHYMHWTVLFPHFWEALFCSFVEVKLRKVKFCCILHYNPLDYLTIFFMQIH